METPPPHISSFHVLVFVLWSLVLLSSGCKEVERQALLSFKQSLSDPAHRLSSWSIPDCCQWSGVSCHNRTGRVVKLDLRNRRSNLLIFNSQEVNSSLLHLKYLQYLDLSMNDFQLIPIPSFFGFFHDLRYLNLSNAQFGGVVPYTLGNLSNLHSLALGGSFESDLRVAGLSWVSGLSSLVSLNLSLVDLSSTPNPLHAISLLPSLLQLRLAFCDMRSVPNSYSFLTNLSALTVLDLSSYSMEGPFPSNLGNFTSLKVLNLGYADLKGPLPNYLGRMIKLEEIDLSSNQLHGTIENVFSNMCNLRSLDLRANSFQGEFPNLFQNSSCLQTNSLEYLALGFRNGFNSTIPPYLGNFTSLTTLDLSYTNFHGGVSEVHFDKLYNLKHLYLSFNSLSFEMRVDWVPPFQLETIDLSSTKLGWPEFPLWLTTQNRFYKLDLYNTSLKCELPKSFFNFSLSDSSYALQIDMSSNQIHGNIPTILKSDDQMLELVLNNNNFTGALPHLPPNMTTLDLSYNNFMGALPHLPPNMTTLDLSHNNFTGTLPYVPPSITTLDLSHNFLSGSITQTFESEYLYFLNLAYNSFRGTIPHSFCKLKSLRDLDLSVNKFTGGLPSCLGDLTNLHTLDVSSNQLVGILPESIGKIHRLEGLKLRNNQLYGRIPSSMKNCTRLIMLDLGGNNFSGSIGPWIGENLQDLRFLSLRSNELKGSIPLQLCLLIKLQFLDLAQNKLNGTIPPCFSNFTVMVTGEHGDWSLEYSDSGGDTLEQTITIHAVTKGNEVEYSQILPLVTLLDLSSNDLVGEIPRTLGKLHALQTLNLSRNLLQGNIPGTIGDMLALESLDLSQNKFSGKIPQSISSLSFLSRLNLSHNNLLGEIPSGYQLQTFDDPSIYVSNPQLCGVPLKKKCHVDEPPKGHGESEGHSQNDSEMNWVYIGMASGHTISFGGFCGVLFLNKKWRYAYYQLLGSTMDWLLVRAIISMAWMKCKLKENKIQE